MRAIVPGEGVIDHLDELAPYESDGLTAYAQRPLLVVLPENSAQISAILRWCNEQQVKVVPRGAGTSLSGGALPLEDGILLGLSRLNKILDIDYDNRAAVVQPGVHQPRGLAGGRRARLFLRTGSFESDRLHHRRQRRRELGRSALPEVRHDGAQRARPEDRLMSGEVIELGGKALDAPGYDLLALAIGSEGSARRGHAR